MKIATVDTNVTNYSDTGLSAGTVYYYQVKAYNQFGDSDYSNMDATVTLAKIPTIEETIELLNQYNEQGAFKNYGIYNSLYVKLIAAQYSISLKDYQSALGQLGAFNNEIEAQRDKGFTSEVADSLLTSANSLIEYLTLRVSLPITIQLYLGGESHFNESTIYLPAGGVVKTVLTGNLKVQLAPTDNPDIASVTILQSDYAGTPLIVNDINFGILWISNDPINLSVGTLDLKTGQIDIVENALVRSQYLKYIGISPVPIQIALKGTFAPMSLTKGVALTIGKGTIPSNVPFLGGAIIYPVSKGCAPDSEEGKTAPLTPAQEDLKTYLEMIKEVIQASEILPNWLQKILEFIDTALRLDKLHDAQTKDIKPMFLYLQELFRGRKESNTTLMNDSAIHFVNKLNDTMALNMNHMAISNMVGMIVSGVKNLYTPEQAATKYEEIKAAYEKLCPIE